MKNSLSCLRTNKNLLLLIILILNIACSKSPGKTSAKLKLFSGNSFSSILGTQANNGLILYGKSSDGKFFTKKIDNDSNDLVFPNGTWNFYAVAWHAVSVPPAVPDFTGITSCGTSSAVLNGADVTIQFNISNAGCNNAAFSADVNTMNSAEFKLPVVDFLTCKSISGITSLNLTACDQNTGANFNKGYATSYRIAAFEQQNFGAVSAPIKIAESACVRADFTTLTGLLNSTDTSFLSAIRIPTTVGNGLALNIEVYYSEGSLGSKTGCDLAGGVDLLPLANNPRVQVISEPPASSLPAKYHYYVKTDASDICNAPRLAPGFFAGGFGTTGSPYALCTKDQLTLFSTNFTTLRESSFDLLTDIDYAMASIAPIGDSLSMPVGNSPTVWYGKNTGPSNPVFDGKNHKITNFMIEGNSNGGANPNNGVGFFSFIKDATIQNLTFNNAVVMSKGGAQVGILAGIISSSSTSSSILDNLKIHGHTEALTKVGAVAGELSGFVITASRIHSKGDTSGTSYIGGLFGYMSMSASGISSFSKMSFFGKVNANQGSSGNAPSWAGGILGYASTATGNINLDQVVVKSEGIEANSTIGGFIGESWHVNITNSYTSANLRASGNTDGTTTFANIGGAIGTANGGSLTNVVVTNGVRVSNRMTADHTSGGVVGNTPGTAPSCSNSFFTGEVNDVPTPISASCPGTQLTILQSRTQASYALMPMSKFMGSWNASTNSAPTLTAGCSTPDNGKFYEVSAPNASSLFGNAVSGDIIICNGANNVLVTLLNRETYLTANYLWSMPDEAYDTPRLSYESAIEAAVPYFKRDCHGHFAQALGANGAGTQADPYWVCTLANFKEMATNPSYYYQLKKNIFFDIAAEPGGLVPLVAADYKLNGNGFGLYDFTILIPASVSAGIQNYGIFSALGTNAVISNLKIVNSKLSGTSIGTVNTSQLQAGILAGVNNGIVQNVSINYSQAFLNATPITGSAIAFAGFVGVNNGLISKGEINVSTVISDGNYPAGSTLYAANAVALNSGTIEALESYNSINRNFLCNITSNPVAISTQENIGAFVALNTGTVKEVRTWSEFMGGFVPGSTYNNCPISVGGKISAFIALNSGTGIIKDFDVNLRNYFQMGTPPAPELFASNLGNVTRGFLGLNTADGNKPFNQSHTLVIAWNPTANSGADASSLNAAIAPQTTCALADSGKYYNVTGTSASSNVGPVGIGDVVMCDGTNNLVIYAGDVAGVMNHPMTDVFYLVKQPGAGPALAPGRFYDNKLEFSVPSGVFTVDDITSGTVPITLNSTPAWAVGTDFFHPAATVWTLELNGGATVSTRYPELVRTGGGMDEIGTPF
jgi:hypothetical protein